MRTAVSDAPPDADGVKDFCESGEPWAAYCRAGNVRVLRVRESESLGPAVARYFASKLWGGEEYFMQVRERTSEGGRERGSEGVGVM